MMIETKRLLLRPYQSSDLEDAKGVLGDRDTMSFYPQPYSGAQIKKMIEKQMETFEESGYGLFAVIEKSNSSFIGDCGITIQTIDGVQEYEIGYRIGKDKWGHGYAAEAALAVKNYGFETLRLKKLCSYMESAHTQSRRVAEKIGMSLEKQYSNPNNRDLPTTVYSVYRNEKGVEEG